MSVLFFFSGFQAEGQHWTPPQSTGRDHSLAVVAAIIDGDTLSNPDEIGVFTTDGMLAGAGVLPESGALGFAVWGDDPLTEDSVEGFTVGDTMNFRVWDAERELELEASVEIISGPAVFSIDSYTRVSLTATENSIPKRSRSNQPGDVYLSAYPNPFNPSVTLHFESKKGEWGVLVTNLTGQSVKRLAATGNFLNWDGCTENGISVASGIYLLHGLGQAQGLTQSLVKIE